MQNKISIIIPVYNVENYIEETLLAVTNQSYKNLEIVVVNDGSQDNSVQIVKKFAKEDERFVIVDKENGGVSDARNAGLKVVTGDYIGFVDPDDLPNEKMFEKLLDSILEYDAQIAICDYAFFYQDGSQRRAGATKNMVTYPYYDSKTALEQVYLGPFRSVWNKLYKSELFKDIEFPKGLIYEGTYVQHKLISKASRVSIVDSPLYFYRAKRGGSLLSKQTTKQSSDWFEVYYDVYNAMLGVNTAVADYCFDAITTRYINLTRKQRKEFKLVKKFIVNGLKKYKVTSKKRYKILLVIFNIRPKTFLARKLGKAIRFILRKIRRLLLKLKKIFRTTKYRMISKFVKKNEYQIMFFSSPDYADNSKALYEEMIKQKAHEKYKLIWAVYDYSKYKDKIPYATVVKRESKLAYSYMIRSKYIFNTHRMFKHERFKSKNQVEFLLWHGNSLKIIGTKKEYTKPNNVIVSADIFKSKWVNLKDVKEEQILVTGLPRNDELFTKVNLKEKFKINKDFNKIILWMPTFRTSTLGRNDGLVNDYTIPLIDDETIEKLNEELKGINSLLLIKMHQHASYKKQISRLSNIWPIKNDLFDNNFTLYNLIGNVDVLLTDYSSVYVDYLIKDKPLGFVYDDFDEYNDSRGFIVDNPKDYMPGVHIKSLDELISFITDVKEGKDLYKEERKNVSQSLNKFNDNNNSRRIIDILNLKSE